MPSRGGRDAHRTAAGTAALHNLQEPLLKPVAMPYNRAHHRFAVFVAVVTFFLIIAGALVTSNDAGLSVPDWPTSFGSLYKIPHLVGGVKFEHTHRMIAQFVGFLSIILAVWTWRADPRRWMKYLGLTALGLVDRAGNSGRDHGALLFASRGLFGARRAGPDIFLRGGPDRPVHRPELDGRNSAGRDRPGTPKSVRAGSVFDFCALCPIDSGRDVSSSRTELVAACAERGDGRHRPDLDFDPRPVAIFRSGRGAAACHHRAFPPHRSAVFGLYRIYHPSRLGT